MDYLLIDKLLRKEHINLPAQIMQHMKHVRKQQNHGLPYPGIVKRILSSMGDYNPEGEELLSTDFEEKTILDWKFEHVPAVGWRKDGEFEATLEGIVDDERELFEEQLNNLKKNITFMVANVAGDLKAVEIALDLAQEQIMRGRVELHSLREKLRDIALSAVKDVKDIFPPGTSQS